MPQTFDEQLRRAFDTVAERLRSDLKAHLASVGQDLTQAVDAERADAAWQAARDAITTTERDVTARLTAEFAARESTFATREAEARSAGYAAGLASGQQTIAEVTEQLRSLQAEFAVLNASFETRLAEVRNAADTKIADATRSAEALVADAAREADTRVAAAHDEANRRVADALASADARVAEAVQAADQRAALAMAAAEAKAAEAVSAAEARAADAVTESNARAADLVAAADVRVAEAAAAAKAQTTRDLLTLVDAMRTLDRAASLSEALDALGQTVRPEADRIALFLVRDGALRTWSSNGFDTDAPQPEVPLGAAGLIGEAVRLCSARSARAAAPDMPPEMRPAFASAQPCATIVATPVVLHGKTVAAIYGELAADAADPARLTLFCELVARHAARLLESLTVTRLAQLNAGPTASSLGA
jgi:chemotaxis protein histidine kinase CheA